MTIRLIMTIKKKKGISRAQFIEYYEGNHIDLATRILPSSDSLYRRNYIVWDDPLLDHMKDGRAAYDLGDDMNPFDCFTETEAESREEAEARIKAFFDSEVFAKIRADEDEFVEPGGTRFYVVETRG